jgi:hypothetical protein
LRFVGVSSAFCRRLRCVLVQIAKLQDAFWATFLFFREATNAQFLSK